MNFPEVVDPLEHPAWDSLLAGHPEGSVFHGAGWARVLRETYGHQPLYFCGWEPGRLGALLAVMEVGSRWTGRRGVSLPFTDLCRPLGGAQAGRVLFEAALAAGRRRGWRYLESRGLGPEWPGASPSVKYYGHVIDLEGGLWEERYAGPVRRGIRKARGAGLRVEFSEGGEAMRRFYRLHCMTRRRHGVPPQPARFFENIGRCLLGRGGGFVATAWRGERAVAGAVYLVQGREAIYKFGASDYAYQEWRPNNLVMGEAIGECARRGCGRLHLGRTSLGNEGLRRFKLAFGAREEIIAYSRYDFAAGAFVQDADRSQGWLNWIFRCLPVPVLRWAGGILYPHLS